MLDDTAALLTNLSGAEPTEQEADLVVSLDVEPSPLRSAVAWGHAWPDEWLRRAPHPCSEAVDAYP